MKKKMLLFGGTGLIGSRIKLLLNNYDIYAPNRSEVDITKSIAMEKVVAEYKYDLIVYAAGITNQDIAESNKELTCIINTKAIEWIAKAAAANKIPVVYFSTDAVFPGTKKSPYTEKDNPAPINYYGKTKLAGEEAVLSASSKNLRLISVYTGSPHHKTDFARLILRNLSAGKSCYGITDQYFNPGFADNIVLSMNLLVNKKASAILHLGSTDYLTNYEFTKHIAKKFSLNEKMIKKIKLKDFFSERVAKRGKYAWLDSTLSQKILGVGVLQTNQQNIDLFYKQILFYQKQH
jgi:dTDP-4-dehydrorhamnose reductase